MRFDRRIRVSALLWFMGPMVLGSGLGAAVGQLAPAGRWALFGAGGFLGSLVALVWMRTLLPACTRAVDEVFQLRPQIRVLKGLLQAPGPVDAATLIELTPVRPASLRRVLRKLQSRNLVTVTYGRPGERGRERREYQLTEQGACVARIWSVRVWHPEMFAHP